MNSLILAKLIQTFDDISGEQPHKKKDTRLTASS